jgi:MoaA/NifB/PqqE/SkfB family radical SAM enzyme
MPLSLARQAIDAFPTIRSVELGLGEPTLHPNFAEIVRYIHNKGLKVGMGTNGTMLPKHNKDFWQMFSWLSIGITRFIDNPFQEIPDYDWLPCRHSYILVLHQGTPSSWEQQLEKFRAKNAGYVSIRLDVDANSKTKARFEDEYPDAVKYQERLLPYKGICYWACLKPMVYPNGVIYPCCSAKHGDYYRDYRLGMVLNKFNLQPIWVDCARCGRTEELSMIHKFLNDPDPQFM